MIALCSLWDSLFVLLICRHLNLLVIVLFCRMLLVFFLSMHCRLVLSLCFLRAAFSPMSLISRLLFSLKNLLLRFPFLFLCLLCHCSFSFFPVAATISRCHFLATPLWRPLVTIWNGVLNGKFIWTILIERDQRQVWLILWRWLPSVTVVWRMVVSFSLILVIKGMSRHSYQRCSM